MQRALDCRIDLGIVAPEHKRGKGAVIVDVTIAIRVPEERPLALHKDQAGICFEISAGARLHSSRFSR